MTPTSPPIPIQRIIVGEIAASADPLYISTVVGSCIATCLYDPVTGVGGMNHFLLPASPRGSLVVDMAYGVHAIDGLINKLIHLGASPNRLLAKVFGAADSHMVDNIALQAGNANHVFVFTTLAEYGIPVVAHSLGGPQGRYVRFAAHRGEVLVRTVKLGRYRKRGEVRVNLPSVDRGSTTRSGASKNATH